MTENAIVIVVDALRRDRLGCYGSDLRTPAMDRLADGGVVFDNAFACSNVTDVCVTSLLTGEYPLEHGVLNHGAAVSERERRYGEGTRSIAERLSRRGYTTGAIEPVLERWHRRGFDSYWPPEDKTTERSLMQRVREAVPTRFEALTSGAFGSLPHGLQYRVAHRLGGFPGSDLDGETVTREALEFVRRTEEPFLLFIHYWDVHTPYNPPADYIDAVERRNEYDQRPLSELLSEYGLQRSGTERSVYANTVQDKFPRTVGDIVARYDAAVEYVDDKIEDLLTGLRELDALSNSAVVLTADHGESLTEHGILFDHHGLYDQTLRVPLIVQTEDHSGRVSGLVQHYDVVPTLLDALDEPGGEALVGGSVLGLEQSDPEAREGPEGPPYEAVYGEERHTQSRRAIRTKNEKLIYSLDDQLTCRYCGVEHAPSVELYNLETDPGETENLAPSSDEQRVAGLREQFERFSMKLSEPTTGGDVAYDEAALERRLGQLGYR